MAASNRLSYDFNLALHQTALNNQLFVNHHRPDATGFLNVLQGRNERESKVWYEHMKAFPFSGWAFAGAHLKDFSMTLQRLIDLRDENLLQTAGWIHMLGKGEPDLACLFTVLQRAIRAQINPSLQISFDNASHSRVSGIYSIYDGAFFDKTGWGIVDIPLYDHSLVGSTEPLRDYLATNRNQQSPRQGANAPRGKEERQFYRLRSALGEKLTVGDICIDGTKRTPWDQASGLLIDHHNIEMAIRAYRKAHELFFDGGHVNPVPTKARVVAAIIDEVFKSDRPDLLIAECYAALHDVTVNYPRAKKFASIS